MKVSFLPDFIADLQTQADANFARRVFLKLFEGDGSFREDVNDHRYQGISNAWIRYVSQGRSAFRVIYLKDGDAVQLYRAGQHSVEDNLASPASYSECADVGPGPVGGVDGAPSAGAPRNELGRRIVCNLRTPGMWQLVFGRRLIPHKEVVLVSPFLSHSMFYRTAKLGKLLDDWMADGTKITLVTRPPISDDQKSVFEDLDTRGVDVLFHQKLHSKLYIFEVDKPRLKYDQKHEDLLLLGSANLTQSGFVADREKGNEELCYRLPLKERDDLESYVTYLAGNSSDLIQLKIDTARQKKRANS